MPRALKVFRTPIGFHDAYVAAPTKKAALEAWGSTHDLFARGIAEIVTDPALTEEPLASPGKVIKRSRGTTAEQIAALPAVERPDRAANADEEEPERSVPTKGKPKSSKGKTPPKPKAKPKPPPPRPSPDALEAAEAELETAKRRHEEDDRALAREQAALDRRRRDLERTQAAERAKLQAALDRADTAYAAALKRWRAARSGDED
ncbi:hypothetical protein [Sphingomonas echinoides]|uniref:hypothetical protein n=1 Tax=Sphingomonas echinoides TaxID=59803 RepID=UPI002413AD9E|nr:hypothetical protein [Sphingomonas echinoides]